MSTSAQRERAWLALEDAAQRLRSISLRGLFDSDPRRVAIHSLAVGPVHVDFSRQRIDQTALNALHELALACAHAKAVTALFDGAKVNSTEQRAALHTALRVPAAIASGSPAAAASLRAAQVREHMTALAARWQSDPEITDVIHVGIGGSDLGPRLVCEALRDTREPRLRVHFLANVDGHAADALLHSLNPRTTRVCLVSKSFSTDEMLLNAATLARWQGAVGTAQFAAVTANAAAAKAFGIAADNVLELWDWVGGRYSLWSAVGLPIVLMHGARAFERLLTGAHAMDVHYAAAPPAQNLPLRMALIGLWNRNLLGYPTLALAPYDERLRLLPAWLQQTDMESNGKRVDAQGVPLQRPASPVIWGEVGSNAQHAYFQSLHQGIDVVPMDFVGVIRPAHDLGEHHDALLANLLAQSSALMSGTDGGHGELAAHRRAPGDRPHSVILLDELTPESLGALLAMYEHKVHAQGVLWGINSFDQFGVELGKVIARELLPAMSGGPIPAATDASTRALLAHIRAIRQA